MADRDVRIDGSAQVSHPIRRDESEHSTRTCWASAVVRAFAGLARIDAPSRP